MSVTQTTEPEVGSEEALAALFADAPLPAPSAETPSPTPPAAADEAPAGTARAERATAPTGTDADAPPAESAEVAPAEPETAAARTTFPKWWKGDEAEWQIARAEQNRAANRERDRAAALERELAERAERETFLTAQTLERDRAYRELLVSIAQERQIADPERFAQDYLDSSIAKGNQAWGAEQQQRQAAEAEARRVEAEAERQRAAAAGDREAQARLTFATHLMASTTYAAERGVAGLDLAALYGEAWAQDEIADDIAESRAEGITDERRERLVARVYKRADAFVRERVDAAGGAKAAATETKPDTSAGRKTAVGGTAAGTGSPVQDFSAEAFDREMTAYYAAQDAQRPRVAKPMLR